MDFNLNEDFSDFKENSPLIMKMKEETRHIASLFSEIEGDLDINERQKARENIIFITRRLGILGMLSDLLDEDEQNEISEEEVEEYFNNFEEITNQAAAMLESFPGIDPNMVDLGDTGCNGITPIFGGDFPDELKETLKNALSSILPPDAFPETVDLNDDPVGEISEEDKKLNDDEIDF